jgi:hypothetical protein
MPKTKPSTISSVDLDAFDVQVLDQALNNAVIDRSWLALLETLAPLAVEPLPWAIWTAMVIWTPW